MNEFVRGMLVLFMPLFYAFICYLFYLLSNLIKGKIEEAKKTEVVKSNMFLSQMFDLAADAIEIVTQVTVGKIEQIMGKDLRQKVKDGTASKTDLYALADDAYREIVETVSPEIIKGLEGFVDNTELYIRNKIEEELLKLKSELYS